MQICLGTSPVSSWAMRSKSCCERSSSHFTARSSDRHAAGEAAVAVDARHRPGEARHVDGPGALTDLEEVGHGGVEPEVAHRVEHRPWRHRLVADGRDHLALVPGPVDVAERWRSCASVHSRARPCRRPPGSPSRCRGWPAGRSWPASDRSRSRRRRRRRRRTRRGRSRRSGRSGCRWRPRGCAPAAGGPPNAYAALTLVVPWPGIGTIVSRGIDMSRLGPDPVCSSMIVSVRCRDVAELLSWRSSSVRPARESLPTRRYVVPGCSSGRLAVGLRVDLLDLGPRPERHGDQEDQPQQQHPLDHAEAEPRPPPPRRRSAGRPGARPAACGGRAGRCGGPPDRSPGQGRHHPGLVGARGLPRRGHHPGLVASGRAPVPALP